MNKFTILCLIAAAACGNSSTDNESVGQVKKVIKKTPIICPEYTEIDLSLGVVRNGVGSMSHEDIQLAVDNSEKEKIAILKKAADDGSIIKVTYDVQRVSWCWPDHRLNTVTIEAQPSDVPRS